MAELPHRTTTSLELGWTRGETGGLRFDTIDQRVTFAERERWIDDSESVLLIDCRPLCLTAAVSDQEGRLSERRPCPAPAKPPPELAGSEPPVAPPAWEPTNKGAGILLPMTDEDKQRNSAERESDRMRCGRLAEQSTTSGKAVVEKAKAQGIPLKVRLPDAALGVVRPLLPGCPAKKRLPWPELMEDAGPGAPHGTCAPWDMRGIPMRNGIS
eukprot:Skav222808  [mRNA]  locus=scaffold1444:46743:50604:+ [translate_table: standard]